MESENFIFSRHSERSDGPMGLSPEDQINVSERYPSITKEGEKKIKKMVDEDFVPMVENMEDDGIFFINGSSEEQRTKDTLEVAGNEIFEKYEDDEDVIVFTKEEIDNWRQEAKNNKGKVLDKIKQVISDNKNKKIIFSYPIFLKEFSLRPHARDKETGKHTSYMKELLKIVDYDETKGSLEWFKNEGKIKIDGEILEYPSPQKIAEKHIDGINRLKDFYKDISQERPISVGFVAHGWQLDALAVYLANNGKVDADFYEKEFLAEPMQQPETGRVVINDGQAKFIYRGREYEV